MRKGTKPAYRPTNSTIQQGHYMTEQTMAFCQALVKKHQQDHPNDPLPFPFNDPDPQIYTPLSESHPWHTQIHRDAFGYGEVASNIDQRLVVDLRFFGYIKPIRENWVEYKKNMTDGFGMPQVSLSLGETIRGAW
jgi:pyranose oxidase